jgi:hypothetical protein
MRKDPIFNNSSFSLKARDIGPEDLQFVKRIIDGESNKKLSFRDFEILYSRWLYNYNKYIRDHRRFDYMDIRNNKVNWEHLIVEDYCSVNPSVEPTSVICVYLDEKGSIIDDECNILLGELEEGEVYHFIYGVKDFFEKKGKIDGITVGECPLERENLPWGERYSE